MECQERIALILDTDIGSDIDDAVALAYLLRQPRCELLGVTTVTGDTRQRAALCDAICRAAGREDVPIHAGASRPLLDGPGQPHVPQYEAIAARPHRSDWPPSTAIEFLRQTIRERPGEVTLLAIGPMTNLALLFATDPETASLLKRVVLMCGVYTCIGCHGPGAVEWNAMCDPEAAAITFRARPAGLTAVGLDVTNGCTVEASECRQRFARAGGALSVVAEMAEVYFRGASHITFHDPLAAASVFEPDLCKYEEGEVEVETHGLRPGLTWWRPAGDTGPHRIATGVDSSAFFDHYFQVVGAAR